MFDNFFIFEPSSLINDKGYKENTLMKIPQRLKILVIILMKIIPWG
jgi:hypothetical protein